MISAKNAEQLLGTPNLLRLKTCVFATLFLVASCTAGSSTDVDSTQVAATNPKFTLTVNSIPKAMNGSVPFTNKSGSKEAFTLALPTFGFTVDISGLSSNDKLRVYANYETQHQDLTALFQPAAEGARGWTWRVPQNLAFPDNSVVTFTVETEVEGVAYRDALVVRTYALTPDVDPFDQPEVWVLVFDEDAFGVESAFDHDVWKVKIDQAANGVSDFEEELRAIGLGSANMTQQAAEVEEGGLIGTNAIVRRLVEDTIVATARKAYLLLPNGEATEASVPLQIFRQGDARIPVGLQSVCADDDMTCYQAPKTTDVPQLSTIAVGGRGGSEVQSLGTAPEDHQNRFNERLRAPDYGVFTSRVLEMLSNAYVSDSLARKGIALLFGAFMPELGGVRFGEHVCDASIVRRDYNPLTQAALCTLRRALLYTAVNRLGERGGYLAAHEMGHALGLVANGPPPYGLFGGEYRAEFVNAERTTEGHIDTDAEADNIMEAGTGKLDFRLLFAAPKFNALELAYLRRRLLVLSSTP